MSLRRRASLKDQKQMATVNTFIEAQATTHNPRAINYQTQNLRAINGGVIVNDVHSQLNRTRVAAVVQPRSVPELAALIERTAEQGLSVCVAGSKHAMGTQQFAIDAVLIDTAQMNQVLSFDPTTQLIEVEAGIHWPELIAYTLTAQRDCETQFGIIQKQTGADRLSIGGALAANIHGRGLRLQPFINDVESFVLIDSASTARRCSRTENAGLFRLAIGGYGLFGIIASVQLRLARRQKLRRVVEIISSDDLAEAFQERIDAGFLYGDFQFMTDASSADFLRRGVFSCYCPAPDDSPAPAKQQELSAHDWKELLYLAHTDRRRAFELYSAHYLSTNNQIYWSDTHQSSTYLDGYHSELDVRLKATARASEMITEVYVPRKSLTAFLDKARADFRRHKVELIYGTIRLIEKDAESFLAWAKESYACIVFNLHVAHTGGGIEKAQRDFRRLIDLAIEFGGSYYLTYHRWATRRQVETCYPQFPKFLHLKQQHDPAELFQSDWYRHYKQMFAGML